MGPQRRRRPTPVPMRSPARLLLSSPSPGNPTATDRAVSAGALVSRLDNSATRSPHADWVTHATPGSWFPTGVRNVHRSDAVPIARSLIPDRFDRFSQPQSGSSSHSNSAGPVSGAVLTEMDSPPGSARRARSSAGSGRA
jgi:hypothetical protein